MAKVLAVTYDMKRLFDVNSLLRAHGHDVRGADCPSTMRRWLAQEPFQFIVVLDELPREFSEVLRRELHAGRKSPRLLRAEGLESQDVIEMLSPSVYVAGAA
jgi:hypothetical protein